jgi:hypothetical protein
MSVPGPGIGKPRSQGDDHLAGLASRYLEQNLDRGVGWHDLVAHLEREHGKTYAQAQRGTLFAVLDLEHSGTIAHEVTPAARPAAAADRRVKHAARGRRGCRPRIWLADTGREAVAHRSAHFRRTRRPLPPLRRVSAMHERLKKRELECHLQHWSLRGEQAIIAAKLADPSLPIAERVELEQQVEAELVADYVESLDHRVEVEYRLPSTRRLDIYDRQRRLVTEAKATCAQPRRGRRRSRGSASGHPLRGYDLAFAATLYVEHDVIWHDGDVPTRRAHMSIRKPNPVPNSLAALRLV